MKIYIIRHGETDLNVQGVMQGWLDEPLNQSGRDLAEITGRALKDIHFDYCISSPLIRSKETVELVLKESGNEIPILTDDRIKEIHFGDIEGEHLSALGEKGELFHDDPFHFGRFPNGESVQDVCQRTQEFLKELIARDDDKTYLIGIHGCAVRAMLNFLYENPDEYWHGHVPYNCSVNIIEAKNGVARLVEDDKIYYPQDLAVDRYKKEEKKSEDRTNNIQKIPTPHPKTKRKSGSPAAKKTRKKKTFADVDIAGIIPAMMKEIDSGKTVRQIARKHKISVKMAEDITRMYLTHPEIDVQGILGRIEGKE